MVVDLHSHILPGIDDGPEDMSQALEMVRQAAAGNISAVVATPHCRQGIPPPGLIKEKLQNLEDQLVKQDIDLLPGCEVFLTPDLPADVKENKVLGLNESSYLLVEFPFVNIPREAEEIFYDLRLEGYNTIIAHPARYRPFISDPGRLYELVQQNYVFAQLNAGSLLGEFGASIKKTAYRMLENNLIHFVASDTHNADSRSNKLPQALEMLQEEYPDLCDTFQDNARKVLEDDPVSAPESQKPGSQTIITRIKNLISSSRNMNKEG